MKDLIDERNRMEKMRRSVVKAWNVNYIDPETMKKQQMAEAQEVLERLEQEKKDDEAEKAAEIQKAYEEVARREGEYNATTNSYSGSYGKGEVDDVTKGQIDLILNEKDAKLRKMIDGEL